jgi:hypothetical protein
MKKLRNFILSVAVILIGTVAAFATNAAKSADDEPETGYYYDESAVTIKCIQTDQQCSPTGTNACTWTDNQGTHTLYRKVNDTMCGDMLFERQDN